MARGGGRWLAGKEVGLDAVTSDVVLDFLRACREARLPGRPPRNVVSMTGRRLDRYAFTTNNRRLRVLTGLSTFRHDQDARSPVP